MSDVMRSAGAHQEPLARVFVYWSYQLAKLPHSILASLQSDSLKDDMSSKENLLVDKVEASSPFCHLPLVISKSQVHPNSRGRNIDLPHHGKSAK